MSSVRAVIIGASGHGRELLGWLRDAIGPGRCEFLGLLDDGSPDPARLDRVGARHLGPVKALTELGHVVHYVGIGDPAVRREVARRVAGLGSVAGPAIVYPSAHVGADVLLGPGTVIAAGVVLTTNIRLGEHVHVSSNAVIGHDAVLGNVVSVYPGATVSGNVTIDSGVTSAPRPRCCKGCTSVPTRPSVRGLSSSAM